MDISTPIALPQVTSFSKNAIKIDGINQTTLEAIRFVIDKGEVDITKVNGELRINTIEAIESSPQINKGSNLIDYWV